MSARRLFSLRPALLTIVFPSILFLYFYCIPTSIQIPQPSSPAISILLPSTAPSTSSLQSHHTASIQTERQYECSIPSLFADEPDSAAENLNKMKKIGTMHEKDPAAEIFEQNISIEDWDFLENWEQGDSRYISMIEKAMQRSNRARTRVERNKRVYELETESDWLEFIFEADDEDLPPLTKFAQSYIYERQHPESCREHPNGFVIQKKFPVDKAYGLGAVFQSVATDLAYALRTGRTLVYTKDPPGQRFITPSPGCGHSLDCIFHKISSCSPFNSTSLGDNPKNVYLPASGAHPPPPSYYETNPESIPPILGYLLRRENPEMTHPTMKYWWRTQAMAYVMRLNKQSLQHLYKFRTDPAKQHGLHVYVDSTGKTQHKPVPFTFPLGTSPSATRLKAHKSCWAIHVRHGDKSIEMALRPLEAYLLPAQASLVTNPLSSLSNCAFISTEDPEVLEKIKEIHDLLPPLVKTRSLKGGFTYYWSDIFRINGSPEEQLRGFTGEDRKGGWNGKEGTRTELTLMWLGQAVMQGEAAGFVGTRGSGWNRLIDTLRCVWFAGCRDPWIEVGTRASWENYGP